MRFLSLTFSFFRLSLLLCFLSSSPLFCVGLQAEEHAKTFFGENKDEQLQGGLARIVTQLGLLKPALDQRLAVAVADISNPRRLRYAGINDRLSMYAASLPKIAILFGLIKRVELGNLAWNEELEDRATSMIRDSSNNDATRLFYLVGPAFIAQLLQSPAIRLYESSRGEGGLWIGKEYGKGSAWALDPVSHLSHSATARQAARFYYLLESGQLASPELTLKMKSILASSNLMHKFAKGLSQNCPGAVYYRKSGSWKHFHSDSALIEHHGKKYVVAALANDEHGANWLEQLIVDLDRLVLSSGRLAN